MADPNATARPSAPYRYTTTHDPSTGKAIFSTTLPETVPGYVIAGNGMQAHDTYKTFSFPFDMSDEVDIAALQTDTANHFAKIEANGPPSSVWFPRVGESLVRYCDWGPGVQFPMHRTETIDFGVVLQGEMELTLDSGEKRILRVGDMIVQRGTLHAWRNPSDTTWARLVFFLLGTPPVRLNGVEMKDDLPWQK
ncbi:hypothetical protein B0H63DRAFT_485314 [Podospora didyma]|uniref:Cupin type-2 domain-containing protein n=1 Tax=Podospora didyma TaxID=330526 RepID=A0AAE0N6K9_9PEZI|nr:hypothetical protein B0H63DRAFT_485314 [Podospora didyma]